MTATFSLMTALSVLQSSGVDSPHPSPASPSTTVTSTDRMSTSTSTSSHLHSPDREAVVSAPPASDAVASHPASVLKSAAGHQPTTHHEETAEPAVNQQSTHSNRFSIAREKTSSVFSNLALRSKPSAGSLRSLSPRRHHQQHQHQHQHQHQQHKRHKQATASSSSSSRRRLQQHSPNAVTSPPSRDPRPPSSTSTITPDNYHHHPHHPPDPSIPHHQTRDRLPLDRASIEQQRLLDRSPSPTSTITEQYPQGPHNKMHQTSSRLLRMTEEERPFTRDFKDLFATLMVSLPLSSHRIRFQRVEHTFTSEEAINNLGSLKFSQSNRMPDPKDPTRIVTTTTTTTFSMAKEMARSVCQRFVDARFIESGDGKPLPSFPLKGAVWQLTPKGMHVLTRFCQRNGINQRHVLDVLDSPRNNMQLVILERDAATDKLSHDRATAEVIFRRFVGQDGPNVKSNTSTSDSDSLNDYYNGLIGVKMAKERRIMDHVFRNTFTGKAAVDWLLDCCTTVDRRETYEVAESFVRFGLIVPVFEDKIFIHQNPAAAKFQPTKNAIYGLTEKGQMVAGWIPNRDSPDAMIETAPKANGARSDGRSAPRDSNNNRLMGIVNDPALRLLFREFLRDTHCEENLAFYLEVREFTKSYDNAEKAKAFTKLDAIRESLAAAYGLYNAFLAPGSPCELNIDHNLRNSLAGRMTRAVGDDDSMLKSLQEVVALFKEAQTSVFKLMSSDSVPKFLKEPKYANVLREHNFDHVVNSGACSSASSTVLPERTLSRVTRDPRATKKSTTRPKSFSAHSMGAKAIDARSASLVPSQV